MLTALVFEASMKRRTKYSSSSRTLTLIGCILFLVFQWTTWRSVVSNSPNTTTSQSPTRLIHQGSFGLGHRLSKLTAAYDLAKRLGVSVLQVDWGHCDDNANIFEYLFASDKVPVAASHTAGKNDHERTILIRNDVSGYYAGQAYKNFHLPITPHLKEQWRAKIESDDHFLSSVLSKFRFETNVQQFQQWHNFDAHTVIGVHIRAGNGERDHFEQASRGHDMDPRAFVQRLGDAMARLPKIRNPLVFVATDTEEYVGLLKEILPYPVVSFEDQPRYNSGVSYQQTTNCLENWKSSVIDMLLLGSTNVLIATSRSTFTQIAPSLLVWKKGGRFCEYDHLQFQLSCFDNADAWLFDNRKAPHKVMVHLPDPEPDAIFASAVEFLQNSESLPSDQQTYYYGRKYNKKYRQKRPFRSNWTWG